jgi:hypothetical protein
LLAVVLAAGLLAVVTPPAAAATVGYVGPSYVGTTAPTGQKPQSKLWYADGQWWGVLWDTASRDFHIFRYDWNGNAWHDTGVLVDERSNTYVDALWNGTNLYVASAGTSAGNSTHSPRLTKFGYNAATDTWTRASGFPVTIGNGGVEAAVIAEDSRGIVWATYTQGSKVWITHGTTSGNDTWVPRFQLPASGNTSSVDPDDISAVVAFDGDKIGVLWSNERTETMYWATHVDGTADTAWTTGIAYQHPEGADDHINLKSLVGDPSGRVFAVVKTSLNAPNDPLINLLVLDVQGNWSVHTYSTVAEQMTRAIVLIDAANRDLYVFAAAPCCSGGKIYFKKTSLDNPSFAPGLGNVFIASDTNVSLNNPTSTKQNLSGATGLLVLAGDDSTRRYIYNRLTLGSPPPPDTDPPETTIDSAPPATTSETSAQFGFSADEGGSTFRCSLDGAAPTTCTSPKSYSGLGAGGHTFSVAAVDAAGNADPTPATYSWTIESGPPPPVFGDDFSSGSFAAGGWDVAVGADGTAQVVSGAVWPGDPGARLRSTTTTGSTASIRKVLASPLPSLTLDVDLLLATGGSSGQTYGLVKLYDSAGSRVLTLSRDSSTGQLTVVGKSGVATTAFPGPAVGAPAHLTLRAVQNGAGPDSVTVMFDGVPALTTGEADLGAANLQRLRLGDDSLRRAMDVRFDNVAVRP